MQIAVKAAVAYINFLLNSDFSLKSVSKPIPAVRAMPAVVRNAAMCGARSFLKTGIILYSHPKTGVYPPQETIRPDRMIASNGQRYLLFEPVNAARARRKTRTPVNSLLSLSPNLPK